jgi:filamentous hemagglutinin
MAKKKIGKKRRPTKRQVLAKYHLPVTGTFPFQPEKNWHATQPLNRGPGNGFVDRHGREWTPGRSITPGQHFEWDVQLPSGGHLNVDWDGNITHP